MKTNLIKTELTPAQILNPQLNGGYYINAKDLDNLCPIITHGTISYIIPTIITLQAMYLYQVRKIPLSL